MAAVKKEFNYTTEGRLYRISWKGGGEVPASLSGLYTSLPDAQQAANDYLKTRDKVKNAKSSTRA
jgi:hypothetical protein